MNITTSNHYESMASRVKKMIVWFLTFQLHIIIFYGNNI